MLKTNRQCAMSAAVQLFALANEKSSEKRLELLRCIADTFAVESESCSPTVQCLLDEIVTKLVDRIDGEDRAEASSALARLARLPEGVARSRGRSFRITVV
jgi:uncharacterized protein (DUF2336 family)